MGASALQHLQPDAAKDNPDSVARDSDMINPTLMIGLAGRVHGRRPYIKVSSIPLYFLSLSDFH